MYIHSFLAGEKKGLRISIYLTYISDSTFYLANHFPAYPSIHSIYLTTKQTLLQQMHYYSKCFLAFEGEVVEEEEEEAWWTALK